MSEEERVSLARIEGQLDQVLLRMRRVEKMLDHPIVHQSHLDGRLNNYVTTDQFEPIKRAFYWVGSVVLGMFIIALATLVWSMK